VVGIVVLIAAVGLVMSRWAPEFDAPVIAEQIREAGVLGPVVVTAVFVLQCIVAPLPSQPVMIAAGYVYGAVRGFVLSWFGVTLGACACWAVARGFGRPIVTRFVSPERLDAVNEYVGARGLRQTFTALLALHWLSFASFDVLSYFAGLVSFPFRWFVLASAIGIVPKAAAFSYMGATIGTSPKWVDAIILVGTFGVILLLPFYRRLRIGKTTA
jgi:uncharacterized membrane protein YdjX (TVP38/TMEM64 family)